MRGRRPKPDAIKQLAGYPGKRKPPKKPPSPPSDKAEMPSFVRRDPIARAEWDRLCPKLELLGLIDATNQQTFAAYCLNLAVMVRAKQQVLKEGFTFKTETGQRKKHPAFEVMRAAGAEMRKFCVEHGITPASRARAQPFSPQPQLPGMPAKPEVPTTPADDNERFFGTGSTAVN